MCVLDFMSCYSAASFPFSFFLNWPSMQQPAQISIRLMYILHRKFFHIDESVLFNAKWNVCFFHQCLEMHSIRRSRTRRVEMTAVAPLSDNDADMLPKEVVLPEKMTELRTLEREDTKPPARSRVLRRFPILALYGTACFSLAFISPYIPHLVSVQPLPL